MRGFLTVAAILLGTQIFASSGVRVIDAESALKEREGLNLSRYATSIKYIPLETGLIYLPEAAGRGYLPLCKGWRILSCKQKRCERNGLLQIWQ